MKDCGTCKITNRSAARCVKCLGYTGSGKLVRSPWEPSDDRRSVQMADDWWDKQHAKKWQTTGGGSDMPKSIDWLIVVRLVSDGKLDRRDCAIIDALANGSARGNKTIAAKTGIPVSTVQGRRAKIRAVLATA